MADSSMTYRIPDGRGGDRPASQQEYDAFRANYAQQAATNVNMKRWSDNPNHQYYTKAWDAYGGPPDAQPKGSEDGSQAWKNISRARKFPTMDMQNPVQIDGWWYDKPIPKPVKKPPANLSGGQASVPSVQQRMMSRMEQAVQKGVNKGKINSKQLGKYQVPGQIPASPLVNQLSGSVANRNLNIPSNEFANYTGQASAAQKALNPVPMPQKNKRF
jgi:hypothetical protein